MKAKMCLPIIKENKKEVLQMIKQHRNDYGVFEIWLDYIKDLEIDFILDLIESLQHQVLFVFRRKNLIKVKMNTSLKKQILEVICETSSFVDIDVMTQKKELSLLNNKQCNVILSYHNYEKTPSEKKLETIINEMKKHKPAIYKIATFCKTQEDALRLLLLLLKMKKQNKKCIILGMGKYGGITRILGSLWGNEIIFAPVDKDEQSAPGQLTKSDLESIFSILNT